MVLDYLQMGPQPSFDVEPVILRGFSIKTRQLSETSLINITLALDKKFVSTAYDKEHANDLVYLVKELISFNVYACFIMFAFKEKK